MTIADVRRVEITPEVSQRIKALQMVAFDFDGVFTDNSVLVLENGQEAVRCTRSDGIGLSRLRGLGIRLLILSSEENNVVRARSQKLGVPCINACEDKASALAEVLKEHGLGWHQVAFVGNDAHDRGVLERAGFPVVVADAHPEVYDLCAYRTGTKGGHGAVREICDLIAREKESGGS